LTGAVAAALVAVWVSDLRAAAVTVTFTYTRVVELQCNEGVGESCPNDYYPKVEIGHKGLQDGKDDFCCAHGTDFQPNWVFSQAVDTTESPIAIHVELHDQDDVPPDDELDIANGPNSLDLQLNLTTCTWQGGGLQGALNTQSSSQGSGDDSAKIYFVITVSGTDCTDSDGDGLLDAWEKNGYDADGDGIPEVDLPAMGARSDRKDLFLEIDYLNAPGGHTHGPVQAAVQTVVQAFANAPVPNLDGTQGIQLHIDTGPLFGAGVKTGVTSTTPNGVTGTFGDYGGGGEAIDESSNSIVDFDGPFVGNPGISFFSIKSMNTNRDNIFRYMLFVHQTNARLALNDCTSGQAKGIPGVNFIVSLGGTDGSGNLCWGADALGQSVGTQGQQAGTLMHEFGHTLGLRHGGNDNINNKPNYLSVMSYRRILPGTNASEQSCGVPAIGSLPGGCDYSRIALAQLNENSLDECQGWDTGALGAGAIDWNGDGITQGATNCQPPNTTNGGPFNINLDTSNDTNGNGRQDAGEPPVFTSQMTGFNDWNAIVYNFRTVFDFTTAGETTPDEPDSKTLDAVREAEEEQMRPRLAVTKTGPGSARPGDTLSYAVTVTNLLADFARGPAINVVLSDTKPDASIETSAIGTLKLESSSTYNLSYAVPCSTADGAVLTNTAKVDGTDLLRNPVTSSSSVQTTIHAPVLSLSMAATGSVNAGEAITYTLTYENAGAGAASNVVVATTLPADVYYSRALDTGAGPHPTSVTANSDGSRTLRWTIGTLAGNSGPVTITFTARPTLLAPGGTAYTATATLGFTNENGCTYDSLRQSADTTITTVPPTLDPLTLGFWKTHPEQYDAEILARIQATDQRFDRSPADGRLSGPEVSGTFASAGGMPFILQQQLLATYFDLATRRINAETLIQSKLDTRLGLSTVRDAALFAIGTLELPVNRATSTQYSNAATALDEINSAKAVGR
jgi:uncharacterized repeat protein (TIGR01451 family)